LFHHINKVLKIPEKSLKQF